MFGFGALRTLLGLAFLAALLWAAFAVPLGRYTFAEHMDRISRTDEARELLEGTRKTVTPVLQEATTRVLGERVEAPTYVRPADVDVDYPAQAHGEGASPGRPPSRADATRLPSRGRTGVTSAP